MKIALQKWNIFPRKLHDYTFLMFFLDFKEKKVGSNQKTQLVATACC